MYKGTIYSTPEAYGLEIVGEFDWSEPDYSFDICVVWKEKRGVYWIGSDSGCSCPSPFEDYYDMNQLDGPYDKSGLKSRLKYLVDERVYGYSKSTLLSSVNGILDRIK